MPFKSKKQMRYMFAKHPNIAKKWADKYGIPETLREKMRKHGYSGGTKKISSVTGTRG